MNAKITLVIELFAELYENLPKEWSYIKEYEIGKSIQLHIPFETTDIQVYKKETKNFNYI